MHILMLHWDILFSTGLVFKSKGLTLARSGITATFTGTLLTSSKIPSSGDLDSYGLKALPAEVPVAPLEDSLSLFLLSSVTLERIPDEL
jgi:hypothetical protein